MVLSLPLLLAIGLIAMRAITTTLKTKGISGRVWSRLVDIVDAAHVHESPQYVSDLRQSLKEYLRD